MSNNGKQIARAMHLAKKSFIALGLDDRCSENLAFHLAELHDDLKQLIEFAEKVGLGKPLSIENIAAIDGLLRDHTHYHYVKLRRALSKSTMLYRKAGNRADLPVDAAT